MSGYYVGMWYSVDSARWDIVVSAFGDALSFILFLHGEVDFVDTLVEVGAVAGDMI